MAANNVDKNKIELEIFLQILLANVINFIIMIMDHKYVLSVIILAILATDHKYAIHVMKMIIDIKKGSSACAYIDFMI